MAISWPWHIDDVGGVRDQFHHMIDIVPTILEAAGLKMPDTLYGIQQRPMDGISLAYTWDKANASAPSQRGMGCRNDTSDDPLDTEFSPGSRRNYWVQLGALSRGGRPNPVEGSGCCNAGKAEGTAGHLLRRSGEV
jgi:hypothetical protein